MMKYFWETLKRLILNNTYNVKLYVFIQRHKHCCNTYFISTNVHSFYSSTRSLMIIEHCQLIPIELYFYWSTWLLNIFFILLHCTLWTLLMDFRWITSWSSLLIPLNINSTYKQRWYNKMGHLAIWKIWEVFWRFPSIIPSCWL